MYAQRLVMVYGVVALQTAVTH